MSKHNIELLIMDINIVKMDIHRIAGFLEEEGLPLELVEELEDFAGHLMDWQHKASAAIKEA